VTDLRRFGENGEECIGNGSVFYYFCHRFIIINSGKIDINNNQKIESRFVFYIFVSQKQTVYER
jgi:hypothetical protein